MSAPARKQYDHRIRNAIVKTGDPERLAAVLADGLQRGIDAAVDAGLEKQKLKYNTTLNDHIAQGQRVAAARSRHRERHGVGARSRVGVGRVLHVRRSPVTEGPRPARDAHEALLRVPEPLRRAAEREHLPGLHGKAVSS